MHKDEPLPTFDVIIVAAGEGRRAQQGIPKQFAPYLGKPLLLHSIEAFAKMNARRIVVVHPADSLDLAQQLASSYGSVILTAGGATRQDSVRRGLAASREGAHPLVCIHDAARPGVSEPVVRRLLATLPDAGAAIPVLPVVDSLVRGSDHAMQEPVDRDGLWRVQTPQAFRRDVIDAAQERWLGETNASDDAQVARAAGFAVALVEGDEKLKKVTFDHDFTAAAPLMRVGSGYDVHRLVEGEELWLGGLKIDYPRGLSGHSDADVALHAITDALLGAIAEGDIGSHFPPSDPRWKGASSDKFLLHAAELVNRRGYEPSNIDLTIICEEPRIGPHRDAMRERIAQLLGVGLDAVSVKATTTERLGFTGRAEGIAAQAVATLVKRS